MGNIVDMEERGPHLAQRAPNRAQHAPIEHFQPQPVAKPCGAVKVGDAMDGDAIDLIPVIVAGGTTVAHMEDDTFNAAPLEAAAGVVECYFGPAHVIGGESMGEENNPHLVRCLSVVAG